MLFSTVISSGRRLLCKSLYVSFLICKKIAVVIAYELREGRLCNSRWHFSISPKYTTYTPESTSYIFSQFYWLV